MKPAQRRDAEVVERLRDVGFSRSSEEWRIFVARLIRYGHAFLLGHLREGTIRRVAAQVGQDGVLGLGRLPPALRIDGDDARDLALLVLERAIPKFRDELEAGRWSPTGGASLRTFFIARCLMVLPDAYGVWAHHHEVFGGEGRNVPLDHLAVELPSPIAGPADAVVQRALVDEARAACPDVARAMLELRALGYSREEIAEMHRLAERPITANDVHRMLAKARRQIRRDLGGARP